MKQHIEQLIAESVKTLQKNDLLPNDIKPAIKIDLCKDKSHGDFACNIAMMLAKLAQRNPRELAQQIVEHLPTSNNVSKVDIAGPGFINFFLSQDTLYDVVKTIHQQKEQYGKNTRHQGQKAIVEFVSANPTGPLHIGHGRGAAYGASIADLLEAVGYEVHREYYVNDAGRQMHILATSIWLRYIELLGENIAFPKNGYKGNYVYGIAKQLKEKYSEQFKQNIDAILANVPDDEISDDDGNILSGDKEAHIDAIIKNAQNLLQDDYQSIFKLGLDAVLDDIKQDLTEYDVHFDEWFSEQSLMDSGALQHGLDKLTKLGHTYKKDDMLWFKATDFGDNKDRVLTRADGRTTYFASDVAYHINKVERGYDLIIDVLGADHHGYVPRVRAAMQAVGIDDKHFVVPLVQFASLYKDGEKIQMSTRSGSFVTLRQLRNEIGKDAARFFYVMRKVEQHMDFDLDLAVSKSNENPIYYIQYAHARVCSVMRQCQEKGFAYNENLEPENLSLLTSEHEIDVINELARFPDTINTAAKQLEPHILINYLRNLAQCFHTYYNAEKLLLEDEHLRNARLYLARAVKQVIHNGLTLLCVNAPERM